MASAIMFLMRKLDVEVVDSSILASSSQLLPISVPSSQLLVFKSPASLSNFPLSQLDGSTDSFPLSPLGVTTASSVVISATNVTELPLLLDGSRVVMVVSSPVIGLKMSLTDSLSFAVGVVCRSLPNSERGTCSMPPSDEQLWFIEVCIRMVLDLDRTPCGQMQI
ncbi:hypothetical protein LSTR_LSTR017490 [Laodelphax striatellus]|uniref:Uncharacterized protein n=1 Tax=Laodelphax striatellus TaxID=195883 RepID=A0A482X7U8_LAOST|nr:hypothetical protein LSTR_LSTR017490 [Laodelphax striatellus]